MHGHVGGDDVGVLGLVGKGLDGGHGVGDVGGVKAGLVGRGDEAVHLVGVVVGGPVLGVGLVLLLGGAVQEEAVAKEVFVDPVGGGGAHGGDGDVVDQHHDHDKDREAEDSVGHDLVDLLGRGELLGGLLDAGLHGLGDPIVAVGGDDGLGVVVAGLLDGLDDGLDGAQLLGSEVQRGDGLGVALEDLDGVPAAELLVALAGDGLGDLGEGLLDLRREALGARGGNALPAGLDGLLHQRVHVGVVQGGDLQDRAAETLGQGGGVHDVAALLQQVAHVEAHDDGTASLEQLRGQVEVALQVGDVDEVDERVGALVDNVVAGDDLLGGVRGEGVDAGEVDEGDVLVSAPRGLLLLDGDAGPVADVAVRAGELVEERGLAAVGVAGQTDERVCHSLPFLIALLGAARVPLICHRVGPNS